MKNLLLALVAAMLISGTHAAAQPVTDRHEKWSGQLTLPGGRQMPLELEIFTYTGTATANVRSPAQGVQNIPVSDLSLTAGSVSMRLPTLNATLTLRKDKQECLVGDLEQGLKLPVNLCAAETLNNDDHLGTLPPGVVEQPDIRFQSADGTWLSGTLYRPATGSIVPVAVLAAGSGPQDRDGAFAGHKPYRNLAIHLAQHGVALFAFDKRGVRRSGGDYFDARVEDYAEDVIAAFHLVKTMHDGEQVHVGLVGHSEGATVVAMAATRIDPAFVVSLGGVGLNGIDAIVLQDKTESMAKGASAAQAKQLQQISRAYYEIVVNAEDDTGRELKARELLASLSEQDRDIYQQYGANTYTMDISNVHDVALHSILATDPTQHWARICAPVLVLNGGKDVQVPAAENVAGLQGALRECWHPASEVLVLPDHNHMFQPTADGNVELYAELPEGFGSHVSQRIADWIMSAVPARSE